MRKASISKCKSKCKCKCKSHFTTKLDLNLKEKLAKSFIWSIAFYGVAI
jgi:hypothetical protein